MSIFFLTFGKFSSIISWNKLSVPSSPHFGTTIMHILVTLFVFHNFLRLFLLCHCFFILLLSIFSEYLCLSSLILCFAWSGLLLNPSRELCNSVIVFYSLPHCLVLYYILSLLIFSFCLWIIFLISFSCISVLYIIECL